MRVNPILNKEERQLRNELNKKAAELKQLAARIKDIGRSQDTPLKFEIMNGIISEIYQTFNDLTFISRNHPSTR